MGKPLVVADSPLALSMAKLGITLEEINNWLKPLDKSVSEGESSSPPSPPPGAGTPPPLPGGKGPPPTPGAKAPPMPRGGKAAATVAVTAAPAVAGPRATVAAVLSKPKGTINSEDRRAERVGDTTASAKEVCKELERGDRGLKTKEDANAAAALKKLSKDGIKTLPVADLEEIQAQLNVWMSQVVDTKPMKEKSPENFPMILKMNVLVREEIMVRNLEARGERQDMLSGASEKLSEKLNEPARDQKALDAMTAYTAALTRQPRDGKAIKAALIKLKQESGDWCSANPKNAAAGKLKKLLAAAEAELEQIAKVEETVARIKAVNTDWDSASEGVISSPDMKGMRIETGCHQQGSGGADDKERAAVGKPGTAKRQADELFAVFEEEALRSNVYAEMLQDLVNRPNIDPLLLRLGDNAAGFVDSSGTMGVDMRDLESLPKDAGTVSGPGGAPLRGGVTKGEIIMHVLEERLLMQKFSGSYDQAHEACLMPDSLQNQYRREMGVPADSLVFDCHSHVGCTKPNHAHGEAPAEFHRQKMDFIAYDSQGVMMTVKNLSANKSTKPDEDYDVPPEGDTELGHQDFNGSLDQLLERGWKMICDSLQKRVDKGEFDEKAEVRIDWTADPAKYMHGYLAKRYPTKEIADQEQKLEDAAQVELKRLLAERVQKKSAQRDVMKSKTAKVTDLFDAAKNPPANDGSQALAALRAERPRQGLNDATGVFAHQNCALTTLGALTNRSSGNAIAGHMTQTMKAGLMVELKAMREKERKAKLIAEVEGQRKKEKKDKLTPIELAELEKKIDEEKSAKLSAKELEKLEQDITKEVKKAERTFKTQQADDAFFVAEDPLLFFKGNKALEIPVDIKGKEKTPDAVGDAQLRGIRGILAAEANHRNTPEGGKNLGGVRYKTVQDGLNDTPEKGGKTYPIAELVGRMNKYPDGTQFQVFIAGPAMPGHWIYAEKYNGKVVMEDYQKATAAKKGAKAAPAETPTGYLADEDKPHNPINDEPDAFDQGMFLALCPETHDASDAWSGNEKWPQLT